MNCPNCGTLEPSGLHICPHCGTASSTDELQELRSLEFLLKQTENWPEASARQVPYAARLEVLRSQIAPRPKPKPAAATVPASPTSNTLRHAPGTLPLAPIPNPQAPPVPFDQWLLSERNIKIALYSGGLLLILAGLIFVGVNWKVLPGPAKFAVTLLVTGLMYVGGYVLFQRPMLKLGGVALLGIASGFLPLNLVVLQIYVLSEHGFSANAMWLTASILCLLLYTLTAYWTRVDLFTYLTVIALASGVTAALELENVAPSALPLTYALLALSLLLAAYALRRTAYASFTRRPLLIVPHLAAPILFITSAGLWIDGTNCKYCQDANSWPLLAALFVIVLVYAATDVLFKWIAARWAAAFLLAPTVVFVLTELHFSDIQTGLALKLLALSYLLVGYSLQRRRTKLAASFPLYVAGYAVAAFVTLQALAAHPLPNPNVALALLADVILLAVSAALWRRYECIYGAAWLFTAPVWVYAALYLPDRTSQGLVLGVLMLVYVAAGYALGRQGLKWGAPFLSAAAFLTFLVPLLCGANWPVTTLALVVISALYLSVALWQRWALLVLPALSAVHLTVLTATLIWLQPDRNCARLLTIEYVVLAVLLTSGAAGLRRFQQTAWASVLYFVAALDFAGVLLVSPVLGDDIAAGIAATVAATSLVLAWIERRAFAGAKLPPLLSYTGAGVIFIGHFYVLRLPPLSTANWPVYTVVLCASFVALAWTLRLAHLREIYGAPFGRAGLLLIFVPLAGAIIIQQAPLLVALTFAIAGIVYLAEAWRRHKPEPTYLSGGLFVVVSWALLQFFHIAELQAYVLLPGLGLLTIGWNERRRHNLVRYLVPTMLGLSILMGSAFWQSLGEVQYAVLLLVESVLAFSWGVRKHSRGFVQIAVLALIGNGVVQYGPAFASLERWIQIGTAGTLLLGGGLVALLRREEILQARRSFKSEWKAWNP